MTPETTVPVKEKKRMARTRHDWLRGHPGIDLIDLDDRLIVKTELPDVKRDEIDLRLEDRDLVIYRARHDDDELKAGDHCGREPALGPILRRIPMPFCVTAGDVEASFNESVLRLEVRRPAGGHLGGEKIKVR